MYGIKSQPTKNCLYYSNLDLHLCLVCVRCFLYVFYAGVSCQNFNGPSDGICPGDDVTFTCVVDAALTVWRVTSDGVVTDCNYRRSMPTVTATCGPGLRFTSSQTDENGDTNNSSLSVVSITNDLNGTSVTCSDGNLNIIGSSTICVVGK